MADQVIQGCICKNTVPGISRAMGTLPASSQPAKLRSLIADPVPMDAVQPRAQGPDEFVLASVVGVPDFDLDARLQRVAQVVLVHEVELRLQGLMLCVPAVVFTANRQQSRNKAAMDY